MNHTYLCLPSRSWYSFTDPGGMEGWVGLGVTHVFQVRHFPGPAFTSPAFSVLHFQRPFRITYDAVYTPTCSNRSCRRI